MADHHESLKAMRAFAAEHLATLSSELIAWHKTSLLCDGKMRELASLCTFDPGNALRHAERCVEKEALAYAAEHARR